MQEKSQKKLGAVPKKLLRSWQSITLEQQT